MWREGTFPPKIQKWEKNKGHACAHTWLTLLPTCWLTNCIVTYPYWLNTSRDRRESCLIFLSQASLATIWTKHEQILACANGQVKICLLWSVPWLLMAVCQEQTPKQLAGKTNALAWTNLQSRQHRSGEPKYATQAICFRQIVVTRPQFLICQMSIRMINLWQILSTNNNLKNKKKRVSKMDLFSI